MISRSVDELLIYQKEIVCIVQQFYYRRETKISKWKRAKHQPLIPKNTSVHSKFITEYTQIKSEIFKGLFRLPLNILEKDFACRSCYANYTHPVP